MITRKDIPKLIDAVRSTEKMELLYRLVNDLIVERDQSLREKKTAEDKLAAVTKEKDDLQKDLTTLMNTGELH